MGAEVLLVVGALKPARQLRRRFQILVEEAVQQQIRGRKKGTPKGGRIIVVADGDIVSPNQKANRTLIAGNPRYIKSQKLVELRGQPVHGAKLVGDQERQLPKNRLGLVLRFGPVSLQGAERIGIFHIKHDGNAALAGLVVEEIQEAADGMIAHVLLKSGIL